MKRILLWLWLLTKRQLKSVIFLLMLLAVPVAAFVVSQNEEFSKAASNVVALCAKDDDTVPVSTVEELLQMESAYEFVLCDSEDTVRRMIMDKEAMCGYIFNEGISEKIKAGKYKNNITVVKNKGDVLADMVNEVVFASFFKAFTKQFMINYVSENEKFAPVLDEALLQLEGAYDLYVDGNGTFKVVFEKLDVRGDFANTQAVEAEVMTFPLRGVMAVIIFMGGLLGVVNWFMDSEKGTFNTLGYGFVNISRGFYVMVPTLLLGISTIVSLVISGQSVGFGREISVMAGYILLIVIVGIVCTYIFGNSLSMVSAIPVILMASILICPVFINLATYLPVFEKIRLLFVPYYYMIFF